MWGDLEDVADTETEALPAEAGERDDRKERTPVEGELERNRVEDVLEADLGTDAGEIVLVQQ